MRIRNITVVAVLAICASMVFAQHLPPPKNDPKAPNQPITNGFRMEGDIKDASGTAIFGVTVSTAGRFSAKTDHNGHFVFPALPRGAVYIVKATLTGYTFQPDNQPVNAPAQGDLKDVKFTGTKTIKK
jgi:Carboxypeptidase regulatory-like domain